MTSVLGSGILGVATEIHIPGDNDNEIVPIADFNLHYQGQRADPDLIVLP